MDLHVDDDGFVRAPAAACYRALTDVGRWPELLPETAVEPLGADRFALLLGSGRRRITLTADAGRWRHDTGFVLTYTGDLTGTAEFWLEPGWGGTVIHHLVHAQTDQPAADMRSAYRRWLRASLWSFKDHLQEAERSTQGLSP